MTEHSLETSAAEQLQTTSVADYIVQRIADEGVTHCFGVAGDYLFPMCNAVEHSPKVKWIGCANELNAAYAADGYSRIRGGGNGRDYLWGRRIVGAEWRDGRESRALAGVSCRRHAVLSEPALEQDRPSHPWRRQFREFRRPLSRGGLVLGHHQSG